MKNKSDYEKGRASAFKDCYLVLMDLLNPDDKWVKHQIDGEVVDYLPADYVRVLCLLIGAKSKKPNVTLKVPNNAKKKEI